MPAAEPQTRSGAGPSDAALVVAARASEPWAREALFRRYAGMVHGMVFRLLGKDDAEVDDIVQDVFVQALASLARLDAPQAFASWLSAIVVRTTSKAIRRRAMLRRFGLLGREAPIDLDAIVSPAAPPDAAAQLRAVYGVLQALPAKVRVPLVLHRVEGASLEEVARLVGASLATVKRRIAEGDRALAAFEGTRP